jgi:signal peptidase I
MKRGQKIGFVLLSLILVVLLWRFITQPYRLSGDCMEPALMDKQLCFLNRILPYLRQYQIGDMLVFKHEGKVWVSRVVALEADTVQIADGSIIVNGVVLPDSGISRNWSGWNHGTYAIDKPFHVPTDHVFVLSDNLSAQHDDSRVFGPVSNSSILGIVW